MTKHPGGGLLPAPRAVAGFAGAAVLAVLALAAGASVAAMAAATGAFATVFLAACVLDLWRAARAFRAAPVQLQRRLPAALALGVARELTLVLTNPGPVRWRARLHDHPDPRLGHSGLPLLVELPPGAQVRAVYTLQPAQRGTQHFAPAELRLLTPWKLFELRRAVGSAETLRVYPNFAAVARYAWLAGDRRLSEIGIKSYTQRGEGTDFKELAEYRPGDDVRHIDWKATLRFSRPIVREFQDERDQSVMFLLDCGRRMRAAEDDAPGGGHFDHALNALMLLSYVALASGDAVGALTYGSAPEHARHIAPRKGRATLAALTAALHDVQPQAEHADLQAAAAQLMQRQQRRSLVVVLTNFRDEDADETAPALDLLRTRHLVLLASLRESALGAALVQPLDGAAAVRRVAAAHGMAQARRDAFARLAARNALMVDCEPPALAAELVNHYHAVKRSGLL